MIIYKATNKINGKFYIGKTILLLAERMKNHKNDANRGSDMVFHRAIKKYGIENFNWEIVEECPNEEILSEREIDIIAETNAIKSGYNISGGGEGGNTFQFLSAKKKKEIGQKISEKLRGKKLTEEHKEKISMAHKGKKVSQGTKEKLSKAFSGKKNPNWRKHPSKEILEKMSKGRKGKGLGKKMSKEFRDNLSEQRSGKGNTMYKKLPKRVVNRIVKSYKNGCFIPDIAKENKICKQKVRDTLMENGFEYKMCGKIKRLVQTS